MQLVARPRYYTVRRLRQRIGDKRSQMCRTVSLAAIVVAGVVSPTYGQPAPSTNYTSIEAEPSTPVQVGYYAHANKDCSPSKLPIVRVVEAPTLGTLSVRPGELK